MGKPSAKKIAAEKSGKASSKGSTFARRAGTTLVLWVIVAAAVAYESPMLVCGLVTVIGVLACMEFLGLLGLKGTPGWTGVCAVTVICTAGHLVAVSLAGSLTQQTFVGDFDMIVPPLLMIGVTVALLFHPVGERTRDMFFGAVFGFVYTALLISFLIRLVYMRDLFTPAHTTPGVYYLLFLLVVTKFGDMGAYVVGSAIGSHKFFPHISPGKTWEGIGFGAFPFSVAGAALIYHFFGDKMPALDWKHSVILGFVLCAVGIVGDLAESVLKRALAKKDSGAVLPGIGGVLDLVDSLLFTAPVLFFYLAALG